MKSENVATFVQVMGNWEADGTLGPNWETWSWIIESLLIVQNEYLKDEAGKRGEDSSEPTCAFFTNLNPIRLYYACKVALEKDGDAVVNFAKLDGPLDSHIEQVLTADFMQDLVDWIETHRDACGNCDKRAEYGKRRLAEDWCYFD